MFCLNPVSECPSNEEITGKDPNIQSNPSFQVFQKIFGELEKNIIHSGLILKYDSLDKIGYLHSVAVAKKYRGCGIASQFIKNVGYDLAYNQLRCNYLYSHMMAP